MKHLTAIKAKLKAQHPGLPDAILDRVANTIAKTVKDESTDEELTAAVANQKDVVISLAEYAQQESDRRVTEALKKAKTDSAPADDKKDKDKDKDKPADDMPAWAKAWDEKLNAVSSSLSALQGEKLATSRREKFEQVIKDAPQAVKSLLMDGFNPESFKDDTSFGEYITKTESNIANVKQLDANQSLGRQRLPNTGGKSDQQPSKEELDAVVKAIM